MISISERLGVEGEGQKRALEGFSLGFRCVSPGIVQTFDSVKQTVVVQLAITEKIKCNAEAFVAKYKSNIGAVVIPLLHDVPICIPTAGGFSLTVPVQPGDECLVVFSDTCFDAWYQKGCPASDQYPNGTPQDQMSIRIMRSYLNKIQNIERRWIWEAFYLKKELYNGDAC